MGSFAVAEALSANQVARPEEPARKRISWDRDLQTELNC